LARELKIPVMCAFLEAITQMRVSWLLRAFITITPPADSHDADQRCESEHPEVKALQTRHARNH
jgi:hypothetical protein